MKQISDLIKMIQGDLGAREGSAVHAELIDTFNNHFRGYTLSYYEPWCAAGLSAYFIKAGIADLIPIECSVVRMYTGAVSKRMVHPGRIGGQQGDIIFYDWDSDSIPDHVGIIESASGEEYAVLECNMSNAVGRRIISKSNPSIYAILRPDYYTHPGIDRVPARKSASFKHTYYAKVSTTLALRTGPGPGFRLILDMKPGDKVLCNGCYDLDKDNPWLYVTHLNSGMCGYCTLYYLRMLEGE